MIKALANHRWKIVYDSNMCIQAEETEVVPYIKTLRQRVEIQRKLRHGKKKTFRSPSSGTGRRTEKPFLYDGTLTALFNFCYLYLQFSFFPYF
jgi:hypothetical protein